MRSFLILVLLTATALPATACPRAMRCLVSEASLGPRSEAAGPRRATRAHRINLTLTPPREASRRSWSFDAQRRLEATHEMPEIWRMLKSRVAARMPRVQRGSLDFAVAPVVVAGSFDTVPGVGVAGDF
ncbi:MAG: hypothetical protein H0X17_21575 [Deltaproteobacteria bacterium]|nr:hypothetical protein [Deltaproteobacteria bacterium]